MLRALVPNAENQNAFATPSRRSWRNPCASESSKELRIATGSTATQFASVTGASRAGATGEFVMRYLFGFLCVCALVLVPLVGCSETAGDGGSGGESGQGGFGGTAGNGGSAGMPECESAEDCDDGNECTDDTCVEGGCSNDPVAFNTPCDLGEGRPGVCRAGVCVDQRLCEGRECNDGNDCTEDTCDPADGICDYVPVEDGTACHNNNSNVCTVGTCAQGTCDFTPVADDTPCGDGAGTCQQGSCVGTFACTEQGIRDAIAVGGGPHTFRCDGPQTVAIETQIEINNDVILDGEGELTVVGNSVNSPLVFVREGITTELHGLATIGGVISNQGMLTVVNCNVLGNDYGIWSGPGIRGGSEGWNATLVLTNSTVKAGAAFGVGIVGLPEVTISNSTVSGGYSAFSSLGGSGALTMTNSTVSGNIRVAVGTVTLTVTHSTVSGNIEFGPGTLTMTNSVVDGDCTTHDDAVVVSNGYNIESPGDTCGFDTNKGDQVNVSADDLNLGPLQDNGGPTMTHALQTVPVVSAAIDQIPEADCGVTTDQRGVARPQGDSCDVGAFELEVGP